MHSTIKIFKKKFRLSEIALFIIGLCSALTGLLPQAYLSLIIVLMCIPLFFSKQLYLVFPFVVFYYAPYDKLLGISVHRIYTLLFFASVLLEVLSHREQHKKFDVKLMIPIGIYAIYCIMLMANIGLQSAAFSFFDILCCVILVSGIVGADKVKLENFFKSYVWVSIIAFISGVIMGNSVQQNTDSGMVLSRFTATFEDPNYMGFFYTLAIFALLLLKLYRPKLRAVLIVTLSVIMLLSLSMTAVIVNVLLWLIYLTICKKINVKTFLAVILLIMVVVALYYYGLNNPDANFLGGMSYRIHEKWEELILGNMEGVTTGRSELAEAHFQYFLESPFFKKMFGGTMVSATYISPEVYGAAHNEYVDMLLNIGIVGFVLMLSFLLFRMRDHWRNYRLTGDNRFLFFVFSKFIWLAYAGTLTLFLDHRFMIPFFL